MSEWIGPSDFCGFPQNNQSKLIPPAHALGTSLLDTLQKSQRRLLRYAGLEPFHLLRSARTRFEALSDFLLAYLAQIARTSGKNYILTIRTPLMEELAKKFFELGLRFDWIESTSPVITKEILQEHLRPRTGVVLLHWICPYTGIVEPVMESLAFLKEEGVMTLLDATWAMGNLFFELKELKADGYLFELEGKGTLLATLPTSLCEKSLRSFMDADEIRQLEQLSLALESRWLGLESRSFELGHIKASFEEKIEKMGWKVHFQEFDRLHNFTCIESPLHPDHLAFLLQKQGFTIYHSEVVRKKLSAFLGDEHASPLLIYWSDVQWSDAYVEKLLKALEEIQKKSYIPVKAEEESYVVQ